MNAVAHRFKYEMNQTCFSSGGTEKLVNLTEAVIKNWAKVLGCGVKIQLSGEKKPNNKKDRSQCLQLLLVP